jgi:hypothetical protein
MEARLQAMLAVHQGPDGSVVVTISPVMDGEEFSTRDATLELTTWAENGELLRGRLRHRASGTVAYFQTGEKTVTELFAALDLSRRIAKTGS